MTARTFRCLPESVPAARRLVREALTGQPEHLVAAVELMCSELASNCVVHARTDFDLALRIDHDIRVEVHDSGPGEPRVSARAPRRPGGRGLRIVDAMSDTWGVTRAPVGKTVWFTLGPAGPAHR